MAQMHTIQQGLADLVHEAQAAFRIILDAFSNPGQVFELPAGLDVPAPELATSIILLVLTDFETPLWLPPAWASGRQGAFFRFHAGAPLVTAPHEAAFAVLTVGPEEPAIGAFNQGEDRYPDRSTTIIVQCAALAGGQIVTLSGPGIESHREISPVGLPADFWAERGLNHARYPLGTDVILTAGREIIGLPRTTLCHRKGRA